MTAPSATPRQGAQARSVIARVSDHGAKIAASRIGCTVLEYRQHEAAGEHWCGLGQHWVKRQHFTLTSGRGGYCHECKRTVHSPRKDQRLFLLTPEGAAAVATSADAARSAPTACAQNATAGTPGHSHCPPSFRWLCDGPLPFGWVKEAACQS